MLLTITDTRREGLMGRTVVSVVLGMKQPDTSSVIARLWKQDMAYLFEVPCLIVTSTGTYSNLGNRCSVEVGTKGGVKRICQGDRTERPPRKVI